MIVTCNTCSRQLAFKGKAVDLAAIARLFGWTVRGGRYHCAPCAELGLDLLTRTTLAEGAVPAAKPPQAATA